MKRLLLYVHFNKYDHISRHVFYQLEHMRPLLINWFYFKQSNVSESEVQKLRDKLDWWFIQRENKGYDFAAWHDGMEFVDLITWNSKDSVTVMNDTCFGLYGIWQSMINMNQANVDFGVWLIIKESRLVIFIFMNICNLTLFHLKTFSWI